MITTDEIIAASAAHFGLESADITGTSRSSTRNRARAVAMYLARELTPLSYPELAAAFQRNSHAAPFMAHRRVKAHWKDYRGAVAAVKIALNC